MTRPFTMKCPSCHAVISRSCTFCHVCHKPTQYWRKGKGKTR